MKILVKAKPGSKENAVRKVDENTYEVSVKALPREGKANEAIIKVLADYFKVHRIFIEIRSGAMAKTKVVIIHA